MTRQAETPVDRREAERLAGLLQRAPDILAQLTPLQTPPPVTSPAEHDTRRPGMARKLSVDALELARQVYYEQLGTIADAARAILDTGLCNDTQDPVVVADRLRTFWRTSQWPVRPRKDALALRDLQRGGLYRSERTCTHLSDGTSRMPAGTRCGHSALADSPYCSGHDPRPEHVAMRAARGRAAAEGRRADLVDVAPFAGWLRAHRARLLAEATSRHANDTGNSRVADWLGIDPSTVGRLLDGRAPGGRGTDGTIRARTISRYLRNVDVTFADVYGFDPPTSSSSTTCPQCGAQMQPASSRCMTCHQKEAGARCRHRYRSGRPCTTRTTRPSGLCTPHERQEQARLQRERSPKPPRRYTGALTDEMLHLALDEHATFGSLQWAAHRLWDTDAHGIRARFADPARVAVVLSQRANREGFGQDPQSHLRTLSDRFGPPCWPDAKAPVAPSATRLVPFAPLLEPLQAARRQRGTLAAACRRGGLGSDALASLVRRPPLLIGRARAETILAALQHDDYATAYVAWRRREGR